MMPKLLSFVPALIFAFALILNESVVAQNFTSLYSFTNSINGADPLGGVIQSGNVLYGATLYGGNGVGNIFKINIDGTQSTNLYSFTPVSSTFPAPITNADGTLPIGMLLLSSNVLYGVAADGGSLGGGTIFKIGVGNGGLYVLHWFSNSDGAQPRGGLVLSGDTLFGTTRNGGKSQWGTVFSIRTDGTGFTNLYNFTNGTDGGQPQAGLLLSSNTLYGTTYSGGDNALNNPHSGGTIFRIGTDGTGFTNLYSFAGGSDGSSPQSVLILSSNILYGTTTVGGSSGFGTVFGIQTGGSDFTNIYSFTGGSDGANPQAGLILWRSTLYGTAAQGGSYSNGTVFAVNTDGTGFTNLHSFAAAPNSTTRLTNSDGALPSCGLILSGNNLYGTTAEGGNSGLGTIFSLSLPAFAPQLGIMLSSTNIILTWPTNAIGFTLQSSTNLYAPVIWSTISSVPALVNGQNTVFVNTSTDSNSGKEELFRLSK